MTILDFTTPLGIASRRVTRATVYLDRIADNVRAVRQLIGPHVQLLAVIKADGYGHGAIPVAKAVLGAGASWLGVACVDEGLALRGAGVPAPILVMGHAAPEELSAAAHGNLTITLGTAAQCSAIVAAARGLRSAVRVHIKIDTGMGRFGLLPEQLDDLGRTLARTSEIQVEGCFTHLARGEEDPVLATNGQLERFESALATLARHGIVPEIVHAANSGATIVAPHARFNMVRTGLLLFGYRPDGGAGPAPLLRPALEVESCLVRVETLPKGARIGYGHMHEMAHAGKVGLVPMGYADGLLRSLSGTGFLVAGGRRVRIIGRISMDQCMVDLSDVPGVAEGDPVAVIGAQGSESVWADDLAGWADTIVYEILCGISPRVPRAYLGSLGL